MGIRDLMPQFLALGEGHAGRGPDHPPAANAPLRPVLAALFAEHPALLCDPSYAEFLRTYAGASVCVYDPDGTELWFAFLIGLDSFGGQIVPFSEEGYGMDADGFLCVAQLYHQRSQVELDFGYYVTGAEHPGIHRIANRNGSESRGWYCESFIDWLRRVVQAGETLFSE